MNQILRLWWPLLLAVALIQAGNGLSGTLVSVTSEARAFAPWLKGLVLSAFYIGSLAGALATPAVIRRLGHIASFVVFTALLAFATAGFAASTDPYTTSTSRCSWRLQSSQAWPRKSRSVGSPTTPTGGLCSQA